MDESKGLQDKLIWLFLLSPGFISVTITGMIVDLGQLSEFQITFYSLVLTIVSLAFSVALLWLYGKLIFWRKDTWRWGAPALLTVTLLLSVALGLGLGIAAERDTFFVKLRALPITDSLNKRSSSRPVTFLLSQNTRGRLSAEGDARPNKVTESWAIIATKGGRQYEGWPEFYGLGNEKAEIYLSPACEISGKVSKTSINVPQTCGFKQEASRAAVKRIPGPGVILYESEIESISLVDRACSICYLTWYPQTLQGN